MRGADEQTGALFSFVSPEALVAGDHPLQAIKPLAKAALTTALPQFDRLHVASGRSSMAPEKLLRAVLLQAFYGGAQNGG